MVFDTGLMIHTCKSLQGLQRTRRFARSELDVRVGNGAKVVVMAVGTSLVVTLRISFKIK
jgi:hypothetical protein